MKTFHALPILILASGANLSTAQTLTVTNAPRTFSIVAPATWIQQAVKTGASRVKFSSPPGTPYAECAVLVKEFSAARNYPQEYFDAQMKQPTTIAEKTSLLSARYSNVSVTNLVFSSLSGFPGQSYNVSFSVGSPAGEIWNRALFVESATVPGVVWTVGCGGVGRTPQEADKAYFYWQNEISRFSTNIRIH